MKPWQQQALAHWEMINRMAARRFPQGEMAEEAALFVMDHLAQDDWRRLQAFTGASSLATYIGALTLRLLEDFARSRFGRSRPPLWVRRLGGIWTTLFRLLCLERFTPTEAVAIVCQQQAAAIPAVEEAAFRLLGEIPSCGEQKAEQRGFCEETTLPPDETIGSVQEREVEAKERDQLFAILGRVLFGEGNDGGDSRLLAKVAAAGLGLEPRERLLLKLCFRDGIAVAEAGRMLGWNRHQAHGRLRRLLARLQRDLAHAGLDRELRLLL